MLCRPFPLNADNLKFRHRRHESSLVVPHICKVMNRMPVTRGAEKPGNHQLLTGSMFTTRVVTAGPIAPLHRCARRLPACQRCYMRSRRSAGTPFPICPAKLSLVRCPEAVSIGRRAVDEAMTVQPLRIDDELRRLAEAATPHLRISEVAELVEAISQTTDPGAGL